MTPRDIITQAIVKFDCALGPYYKHRHLLRDGEVTAEYRDAMRADLAEHILAALAAAGLVVIDPADDELVTEIAKQLLDFAYAIEESSVGDHGYMAVVEVRRVLRTAGDL